MVAALQTTRISQVFGRNTDVLAWVLRDPVTRTCGLLVNLSEFQREFLYRYCVLGLDEGEIADWLAEHDPHLSFKDELEKVTQNVIAAAPALLDVYRSLRRQEKRRKA